MALRIATGNPVPPTLPDGPLSPTLPADLTQAPRVDSQRIPLGNDKPVVVRTRCPPARAPAREAPDDSSAPRVAARVSFGEEKKPATNTREIPSRRIRGEPLKADDSEEEAKKVIAGNEAKKVKDGGRNPAATPAASASAPAVPAVAPDSRPVLTLVYDQILPSGLTPAGVIKAVCGENASSDAEKFEKVYGERCDPSKGGHYDTNSVVHDFMLLQMHMGREMGLKHRYTTNYPWKTFRGISILSDEILKSFGV